MELLYVDDFVLCGELLNEVMNKYDRWKNAVEGKGLRVNVNKTKGMQVLCGMKNKCFESGSLRCMVSGLVVILFSVQNVRGGSIVVVLVCLGM